MQAASQLLQNNFLAEWQDFLLHGRKIVKLWQETEAKLSRAEPFSRRSLVHHYPKNLPSFDDLMAELNSVRIG
jgi:hypothetical protein